MNAKILLPENHHRSLSVNAKMIEEGLDVVESKLRGNANHKITLKVYLNILFKSIFFTVSIHAFLDYFKSKFLFTKFVYFDMLVF